MLNGLVEARMVVAILLALSLAGNALLGWWASNLYESLGLARAQADQFRAQMDMQNRAVEQWQAAALEQAEWVQRAGTEAAYVRVITQSKVIRVMQEPVPKECEAAVDWTAERGRAWGRAWSAGR